MGIFQQPDLLAWLSKDVSLTTVARQPVGAYKIQTAQPCVPSMSGDTSPLSASTS